MVTLPFGVRVVQVLSAAVMLASMLPDARACEYPQTAGAGASAVQVDASVATHCAKGDKLLGQNCSYTTGLFARRVMEEGEEWSWVGALAETHDGLASQVAAPFVAEEGTRVIANELVEMLVNGGHARSRVAVTGKLLDVDGVRYVVLTSFRIQDS